MIILWCFGGTTILGNTHICINTWKPARQSTELLHIKVGQKPRWFWRSTGHPPPALAKTRMQSSFKELPGHVTFRELQGCWENPTELQQFGGLFILLMVQKSQGQPPRMVLKPCKSWDFNYQPQLVSWSRISGCHQQYDTKPKNALTIFAILILPKITRDFLYQV